jgi:hypothetical protein
MHSQRFDLEGNRQDIAPHSGEHNVQGRHQYGTGMHLFSPTGFLDGEYMHRTYWVFGKSWASGAGGYHRAGAYAPAGRLMAFDESRIYGYGRHPVYYKWSTPLEYELFCVEKYPASDKIEYHWSNKSMPVLVQAMVLADRTLFIAGSADVANEEDAFDYWSADPNDPNTDTTIPAKLDEQDAVLENLRGGLLTVVDTADGNSTAEHNLESLPIWDGMVAANGRLYLALQNGKVICLEGSNYPPVVDAGDNQTVYPRAAATLAPDIADDGLPLTDPCDPNSDPVGVTARWTKVTGPGDVDFADPCSANTTATFSQWGAYTLRVTTSDGEARYHDDVDISVSRPGDLDRDYDVDIFDVELLVAHWLSPECAPENDWCGGADQSAGGEVALEDYSITAANWFAGVYPAPPQDLAAEAGDTLISLSWAENTETDLAGYNIYRSTAPGSGYTRLNELLLTEPNFIDSNAVSMLTYYYTVTACDMYGFESDFSSEISSGAGPQPAVKYVAGLGVRTTGLYVTKWLDQAGSNDAAQTDSESRPVLASRAINMQPAVAFDGTGQHLDVGDSDDINTGGPYSAKTLVVVFKTSSDITSRQVIWEQGGGVRGLNIYLDAGSLYINGWNTGEDEPQWGPTGLNTPVLRDHPYVATLVMDAGSGLFEGFVNGSSIGVSEGIGRLYGHSNDCALGHVEGASKFHDLTNNNGPANFLGMIAEFYHFNKVLAPSDRETLESLLMDKYAIAF